MCFSFIPYIDELTTTQLIFFLILTLAVAFVVIVLTIGLVIRKIYQENIWKREESLEKLYRNLILDYLFCNVPYEIPVDDVPRAPQSLQALIDPVRMSLFSDRTSPRKRHYRLVKLILLEFSRQLLGEARARLILLFHELGYVAKEIEKLKSRHWWMRAEAARNLALMEARVAMRPLLQATEDPHPDVRAEAIQALFDLFQEDALPPLLPILKDLSQWMVIRLSGNILRLQSKAVPHMLSGLATQERSVQLLLIDLLGEIKDLQAYEQVEAFTLPQDPEVRASALVALGKMGDARGERHLVKALTDSDPIVRLGAVTGLKHLASPSSAAALRKALHDDVYEVRYSAGLALSVCAEPGRQALIEALEREDSEVKQIAEEFLDELGYFDEHAIA
ncbi:MAG: HEAT repeat domain-containing protein [Bacteroidota bacterium]